MDKRRPLPASQGEKMRLTPREREAIVTAVAAVDAAAEVYLFGSRAKDATRGGDIDLLVVSALIDARTRRAIRRRIVDAIGEQKIDITAVPDMGDPFARLAKAGGVRLR